MEVSYNTFLMYLSMVMQLSYEFARDDSIIILERDHGQDGGFTLRVSKDGKVYTFQSKVESRFEVIDGGDDYE